MPDPFKLIVISPEHKVADEAQMLSQLFEYGLNYFHLRKYNLSEAGIITFINSIPAIFHNRIVLHSNFNLLEKFELKGIHLNEENRSKADNFEHKKIISTSFHSLEEIENNKYKYEYIFLSPVFDSISKPNYKSKFDLRMVEDRFRLWKKENREVCGVIALGGVEKNNISAIKQAGFAGAALLGTVWESKDPVKAFKEIRLKVA